MIGEVGRPVMGTRLPFDRLFPRGEVVTLPGDQPVELGSAYAHITPGADKAAEPTIRSTGPSCSHLTPAGRLGGTPRMCS